MVTLWENEGASHFTSAQNGTLPAVDTIPVGQTMEWRCGQFDYSDHGVVSVGTPSFPGRNFGYACQSVHFDFTFTTPGTYRYADSHYQAVTGTIVVQ